MKYRLMTENDLEYVVEKNNEYYNNVEGCWTYEKAYKLSLIHISEPTRH